MRDGSYNTPAGASLRAWRGKRHGRERLLFRAPFRATSPPENREPATENPALPALRYGLLMTTL
jgi:hypothetical protein